MDFLPVLIVLIPLFLSPFFYPWSVILGFLATIVLVPFALFYGELFYGLLILGEDRWADIYFTVQVVWLFTLPGIIIYFVFIIPIYTLLVKYATQISIYYSFPVFVTAVMLIGFSLLAKKGTLLVGLPIVMVCSLIHSYLALWLIAKFSAWASSNVKN